MPELNLPRLIVQVGWGDFTVRTRRRCFLVAFAVAVHRSHAFIQAGDHILWLRRFR